MSDKKDEISEAILRPVFDFNSHVAMCFQSCYSIQFMRFADSFSQQVSILMQFILPEWHDEIYKNEIEAANGRAVLFLGAIIRLLNRRHFFERVEREDLVG